MATNNFDPTQYGATPVTQNNTQSNGGFNPAAMGATQVQSPLGHTNNLPSNSMMQPDQQQGDWLQQATNTIGKLFPGQQIGNAIGNSINGITQSFKQGSLNPLLEAGQENSQNYGKIVGDTANVVGTIASPLIGNGGSALERIGANTAIGAGLGGANAASQGQNVGHGALTGGALGGGLSAVGEGVNALTENLPKWFASAALPKMKDAADKYLPNTAGGYSLNPTEGAAQYALDNTKGLSVSKMLQHSNENVSGYNKSINTILTHPEYANESGNAKQIISDVMEKFPNAQLDSSKLTNIIKQVAPSNKALVEKVANGTANLAEQNTLRQELDKATKAAYGDKPNLSFAKQIGKTFADSLRTNVQTTAKETAPIFDKFSKEITLNSALQKAVNKKTVAGDLLAGGAGYAKGGIPGAIEGIALERGLRSPSGRLLAGKAIQGASDIAQPVIKGAFQAGKATLIKNATDTQK